MRGQARSLPRFFLHSSAKQLVLIAALNAAIYLAIFTLPFLLPFYYNTLPPVDYAKLTNYSAGGLLAYVAGIAVLFGLLMKAISLVQPVDAQPARTGPRFVFGSSALFAAILVFSYPLTAIDLFIYAIRSRGWALYGLQPLATPPETLPANDPWLGLAGEWLDAASPYGPVWEGLSLAAFYLSGGHYLDQLFALKLIGLLAYLGCAGLVYLILRERQPAWSLAGTLAFAWSPLVLFESVQNGHNDIVMVLLLLAAVWLLAKKNSQRLTIRKTVNLLTCLLLALSILVKFVTLLTVPFFLLAVSLSQPTRPRRAGALLLYGGLIAGLVLLAMQPLWPGWAQWAVLEAGSQAGRSLLALLVLGLRDQLGTNAAFDASRAAILSLFVLIYGYWLWQTGQRWWRAEGTESSPAALVIAPSFHVLFWYVLLVAPVFHAWYLLWFAPLASLLLPQKRPLLATLVFSIIALLAIPYFETIRVWYPFLLRNHFLGHLIGVPLLIVPPALTLLWPISPSQKSGV